jgi:2-phosphosulfolactate phosphatase
MNKIDVYLTQSLINDDLFLKDKNVVVVDVLRATTTITVALANGAKEIIPAESVSTAARISKGLGKSLLCGERNGTIVEGFNLGNSPLEYTGEVIKDKSLIFSTTNGTLSITKSRLTKSCVLGGFINLSKVVEHIRTLEKDVIIVCSGKLNNFCIEDAVCAGTIIRKLFSEDSEKQKYMPDDSAYACLELGTDLVTDNNLPSEEKILKMLEKSEHGRYLISLGFEEDLRLCSGIDSYPYLPVYNNGTIKLPEKIESETSQKSQMKKIKISK